MIMTCAICDCPITPPLAELWCKRCQSYIRAHVRCTGHSTDDAAIWDVIRKAHLTSCRTNGARYVAPWDAPTVRADSILPQHVPGSSIGKRGRR